jgi:peroxin-6
MLYLGLSDTHEAQLQLLQALTRKFRLHPDLDLMHVAGQCTFNFTGADFYALCADAILKAMNRKAQYVDSIVREYARFPTIDLSTYYASQKTGMNNPALQERGIRIL